MLDCAACGDSDAVEVTKGTLEGRVACRACGIRGALMVDVPREGEWYFEPDTALDKAERFQEALQAIVAASGVAAEVAQEIVAVRKEAAACFQCTAWSAQRQPLAPLECSKHSSALEALYRKQQRWRSPDPLDLQEIARKALEY